MKTRFQWIVGGGIVLGVLVLLGAGTIEDSGIFQSLKLGGRTNLVSDDNVDLTYNGAHYQRSVPILNNLTNGIGTNLTSLLPSAVQAGQTNDGTANWSASGTTNSTLHGEATVVSETITNSATGTVPFTVNHASGATADLMDFNVGGLSKVTVSSAGGIKDASFPQLVDTSTGEVTYVLTTIPMTRLIKSGIANSLFVVGNGITNTITGDAIWFSAAYIGTNWYISY